MRPGSSSYLYGYGRISTPQSRPIPGSDQVPNSAGGFAWQISPWERLHRFLILGSEGGTYYASERDITAENVACVHECLQDDPERFITEVTLLSESGRAPKNDPALLALAIAAASPHAAKALEHLPDVARTGTHLFQFVRFATENRGWGRALKRAVAAWYEQLNLTVDDLAYQAVKYRQRHGYSHRDLLRLSHPDAGDDPRRKALFDWICRPDQMPDEEAPSLVHAFGIAQHPDTDRKELIDLILEQRLPREVLPTTVLDDPVIWNALLHHMPMTAMIRNLATMTRVGLIAPFSDAEKLIVGRLGDQEALHKARVHPIAVLAAMTTYASGRGARGTKEWVPSPAVVGALDAAFYNAFANVEPADKRTMVALDVSGSMDMGQVAGIPGLNPRSAACAMAMVTLATERMSIATAFSDTLVPFPITSGQRLDDVIAAAKRLRFGGTDCALPILGAELANVPIDTFVIYTDNETWFGDIHPAQALARYRRKTGIPAKLVVVGMTSTGFSIADPNDPGMLDVVGFDSAAPAVIADFSAGR